MSEAAAIVAGTIVVYLLAFFALASLVLIPLFAGLALRYTFRTIRLRCSQRNV